MLGTRIADTRLSVDHAPAFGRIPGSESAQSNPEQLLFERPMGSLARCASIVREVVSMLAKNVETVIHELGEPRCDACIAKHIDGASASSVERVTVVLGLTNDFKRSPAVCRGCGLQRQLIREASGMAPRTWMP